jgi:(2R)-3-sulfolactate dehydrogenase (NADP+)
VPGLCAQLKAGRIDGKAVPEVTLLKPGLVVADARGGFPQPAFDAGFEKCAKAARTCGVAVFVVRNGWAADVMGWHAERFAQDGFLALGFANVPASISPTGGRKPVFGTNPMTCAIPQAGKPPVVIDQASSVVAKSEIVERAAAGGTIPIGWALDPDGLPTEDPQAALAGSLVPAGGYKGVGVAFIVELFAAVLSGSELSIEAAPLVKADAPPVRLAQTFIVVDPSTVAGPGWLDRVSRVTGAIEAQVDARVPGARRFASRQKHETNGVEIAPELFRTLSKLAGRKTEG